jgi:hypothetical protein
MNLQPAAMKRALLVLAPAAFLLGSCGGQPSRPVDNRAPSIRIVRGTLVDKDTVNYVSEVVWIGWDDDGFIDHYQFAIDIPDSFSAGDIEAPATPGIQWQETPDTEARVLLSTALPETVYNADGTVTISGRYLGDHDFTVRSVDNEGAISKPDHIAFTATNIMPTTTITVPKVTQYASVSDKVYVSWSGRDPDKTTADLRPVAYEYKLIPIASVFASSEAQYAVDVSPGPQFPWTRVPGSVTEVRLPLDAPASYWFVVRAIDITGAVENRFVSGRNAFKMETSLRNYDRPRLTVNATFFGKHTFPDDGLELTGEIYIDRCLSFEMTSDLSLYGGILQGYNIGIDVADTDDFSEGTGYLGWSQIPRTIQPICFRAPGNHTITLVVRDTAGNITAGRYRIRVLALPIRDREVLIVDDYPLRSAGGVADLAMDNQSRALVLAAGYKESDIYNFDPWGPSDTYGTFTPLKRADLGRYRMLVWHVNGSAGTGSGLSVLASASSCGEAYLRSHLKAGGGLWIHGNQSMGSTRRDSGANNCKGFLGNDARTGLNFEPIDMLCLFMKMCGGDFRQVKGDNSKTDGLISALPTPLAAAELFPPLEVDSTAYNAALLGGVRFVDAQFGFLDNEDIEPLYTMIPVRSNSPFKGKAMAWRYADLDPIPSTGPIAIFSFSYHEMKKGSADERTGVLGMARSMGDWFRSHIDLPGS